jgi:hypothetical protein
MKYNKTIIDILNKFYYLINLYFLTSTSKSFGCLPTNVVKNEEIKLISGTFNPTISFCSSVNFNTLPISSKTSADLILNKIIKRLQTN